MLVCSARLRDAPMRLFKEELERSKVRIRKSGHCTVSTHTGAQAMGPPSPVKVRRLVNSTVTECAQMDPTLRAKVQIRTHGHLSVITHSGTPAMGSQIQVKVR